MKTFALLMAATGVGAALYSGAAAPNAGDKAACGPCGGAAAMTASNKVEGAQCGPKDQAAVMAVANQSGDAKSCGDKAACGDKGVVATTVANTAKSESCCKSTEAKPIAKAGEGCCNQLNQPAKFKVWAGGSYKFYGCADSAGQARAAMLAEGRKFIGAVQPVLGKAVIS